MSFEKNVYDLIKALKKFNYTLSFTTPAWQFVLITKNNKCHQLRLVKDNNMFYFSDVDGHRCTLEIELNKSVKAAPSWGYQVYDDGHEDPKRVWEDLICATHRWLKLLEKDWVKYNKQAIDLYPLNRRKGIVPHALVRDSLSDIYRLDKELGKKKMNQFIALVESGYFLRTENSTRQAMTANDYFEYCRIAYHAATEKNETLDSTLTGRELYETYADGRDDGLLEIEPDSEQAFADWIDQKHPKRSRGGHPFEIKRGGNTTHIDLAVYRPSYSFGDDKLTVSICAGATHRLREAICMCLAIHEAGLPISISDADGLRKRLLAQDNLGIMPHFDSLHRANQSFHEHESVYDVLYYDDLGRYKTRIKPFITWEPLPLLKPFVS